MGKIELTRDGKVGVALESPQDVAQLTVALKAADGADDAAPVAPNGSISLSKDNPFNFIALSYTDFGWSPDALRAALACLAPLARQSLHVHTRSSREMMRRMMPPMSPLPPAKP